MMTRRLSQIAPAALLALALLAPERAEAGLITYTITIEGASGVLDSVGFSNQAVTFTIVGDTANIGYTGGTTFPEYYLGASSATVSVGGITDVISDSTSITSFPSPSFIDSNFVGIDVFFTPPAAVGNTTLLDLGNSTTFAGYALATPLSTTGDFGATFTGPPDRVIDTAGGDFYLTSIPSQGTFFTAGPTVPEPSSVVLMAVGLALAASRIRRR